MLQRLRTASGGWGFRIFLGILVVAFIVLWGASDGLRFGGGDTRTIATVGSKKITFLEFGEALGQALMAFRGAERADLERIKEQLKPEVLNKLLRNALIDQEADNLGLVVTDAQVRDAIRATKEFQDEDGEFDKDRFHWMLRSTGVSEKRYVDILRNELRRRQLLSAMLGGVSIPSEMVTPVYSWRNDQHLVDLVEVKPGNVVNLAPVSEQKINDYYESHKADFTKPEHRDLTVLLLNEGVILKGLQLSAEEIAAGFEEHQAEFSSGVPTAKEREKLVQMLKQGKASAKLFELSTQIEDALAGGATVEEIASKHNLPTFKISSATQAGSFDTSSATNKLGKKLRLSIIKEGFASSLGGDTGLVEVADNNYVAVRVDKVIAPELMLLKDVRPRITKALDADRRQKAMVQLAKQMVEEINVGKPLAQVAKAHKLSPKSNLTVSRSGKEHSAALPSAIRQKLLDSKAKTAVLGSSSDGGVVVAYWHKMTPYSINASNADWIKLRDKMDLMLANDVFFQFLVALEKKYKVEVNERLLK